MNSFVQNIENDIKSNKPEVAKYLNDISQEEAERSFYNTSFSPEKRGVQVRAEYAQTLLRDQNDLLERIEVCRKHGADIIEDVDTKVSEWFVRHRERLCDAYRAWLHSHSRVASSMITGPANFPVERNRKLSGYADAKLEYILEFSEKSIKGVLKTILPHGDGTSIKTDDPGACDKIKQTIEKLESQREKMKAINKVMQKFFKKGEPNISDEKRAECKDELRDKFNLNDATISNLMTPQYHGRVIGFERYQLQNLGANIKRYKERLKSVEIAQSLVVEAEFQNGVSVYTSDDQKICINFGFRPSEEVRSILKKNAFKFSRNRDCAWVRKLTNNAYVSYHQAIKPMLEKVEA